MRKAYTLVEILIALTVIGLLFSFGFVSFRDFSRRQEVSGTAKSIEGDLRLAQGDAISGQKPADVNCASPANTLNSYNFNVYSASEYKIEVTCTGSASPVIIKDVNLPSGITILTPSPNPLKFKILGQGTNVTSGSTWMLTLTQTATNNMAVVTVTSGGEINSQFGVLSSTPTPTIAPTSTPTATATPAVTPTPTPSCYANGHTCSSGSSCCSGICFIFCYGD